MSNEIIGQNIKKIRIIKKGWTQKELANKSGVTRESIGNYERGDRTPPADILNNIAKALGVTSTDLLYPTSDDKRKAVEEAQDILKSEYYDKPAIEMIVFLLKQMNDSNLKNIYLKKITNDSLDSKTIQFIVSELVSHLEYLLYKMKNN